MPAPPPAAHVEHQIEHSSALTGFLLGAVVGAAVGVLAVAAVVATGGAALAVVAAVGGAVASTGGMALAGKYIGEAIKSPKGPIMVGSANVFYGPGRHAAAMAGPNAPSDSVLCKDHGPKRIATGSDSVFVNLCPAARIDDKTECDGVIKQGLDHLLIGAGTTQYLAIEGEVPDWMVSLAEGMVRVGSVVALAAGAAAAVMAGGLCALISFGGTVVGGMIGGALGTTAGGRIGEAIGGELGKRIGETIGGAIGGFFGGKIGNRVSAGHPVDVITGEMFTEQTDFALPGVIGLVWRRFWISSSSHVGQLGSKWHHPYDREILEQGGALALRLKDGRLALAPALEEGAFFYHRAEKLTIERGARGYVTRDEDGLIHRFAPAPQGAGRHLLQAVEEPGGFSILLRRDGAGLLTGLTDAAGRVVEFALDDAGRILSATATAGGIARRLASYVYDAAGDLVEARDALGGAFAFAYDNHLMTRETRKTGLSFWFEWDDPAAGTRARCVKTWGDGDIYWRRLVYDAATAETLVLDGAGRRTLYESDRLGLPARETSPMGAVTSWRRNAWGELEATEDPEGGRATWERDRWGRLTAYVDPDGARTEYGWGPEDPRAPGFHRPILRRDALGHETRVELTAQGEVGAAVNGLGERLTILRDARGLPLALRDGEGVLGRLRWSEAGELLEETTARGGSLRYEYDAFGRIVAETIEGEGRTEHLWDDLDRLTAIVRPDGGRIEAAYDADDHVVSWRDAEGRTTRWRHDTAPLPLERINPDGTRFLYSYDSDFNLVSLTNEAGEVYRLHLDDDGRLAGETGFDGRRRSYGWDKAGRLLESRDGHRRLTFVRDKAGRLVEKRASDGGWARYDWDALGRLTRAQNAHRKLAFGYDALGSLIEERQDGFLTRHVCDGRGRRRRTVLPDGRWIDWSWDEAGGWAGLSYLGRAAVAVGRDRMGRETRRTAGAVVQTNEYDPQGRLLRQQGRRGAGERALFGRAYRYDRSDLITDIEDERRGTLSYVYDARERLRQARGPEGAEVFEFDPAGTLIAGLPSARSASVRGGPPADAGRQPLRL